MEESPASPIGKPESSKIEKSTELFSVAEQKNLQDVLLEKPELVADLEKSARFSLVASCIDKNKELPQDLKGYYQKHSTNQEWLNVLKIYPEDLQRKIIEKRPEGTPENVIELKERLNEEWAKISENFIRSLFKKTSLLEETIENGRFGENYLVKEDEYKIKELVDDVAGWLNQFIIFYGYKSEIFPDQNVRENFGLKNFDPSEITLDEVRKNKEWYQKLDFFIEQYYKFFASGSKENRLESVCHFMDFVDFFVKKDTENYHQNWLFLRNNLNVDFSINQKEGGEGQKKIDESATLVMRKFIPGSMIESTRASLTIWNYINQQKLRFARVIPDRYYIQSEINNHIEPIPELSEKAKEIYIKTKSVLVNSSFKNSKNETIIIKKINFDSGEMELEHPGGLTQRNYYDALKTSIPLKNHMKSIFNKVVKSSQ